MNGHVLITGASSGIGRELALVLAKQGKTVYAVARNEANLLSLKEEFPKFIHVIVADVATEEGRDKIKAIIPANIKISYLVNNAGVMAPSGYLESIDLTEWRHQMAVNVEAPLFLTTQLLPFLHNGRVLNLTIYASFNVSVGLGAYGISKAALNMMTQYLQVELKKYNIAVGSALPGIVETDIQKQLPKDKNIPIIKKVASLKAEGKMLSPQVAAAFLAWLLLETSDDQFSEKVWDIYDTTHHKHWSTQF
ncbi:MAG TPA: SDR family oxidoreductase [Rhabdochlamydiaceae bacterium]|nr:SDR family oxidoreductase [Rhabdochlamydiaceae bacterium]